MPFNITVAIQKDMRRIEIGNISVSFVTLKKLKFFGYEEIKYSDDKLE